ncbi:substrate-binding domain-containing protein [Endozoicomonas arenosclerae]|uniref:substrate-binding domain-containing protein n=1 Tax=Endozoicomonas arenosclerae TaxID=1633495 RepID=UPI0007817AC1|nr:substrate-binding domain-containing protein [Endozoicomonas arenosclerae]
MLRTWNVLCLSVLLAACTDSDIKEQDQVAIKGYYGQYDASQKLFAQPSRSLSLKEEDFWTFSKPDEKSETRIGILFPNTEKNDPYWSAVRSGIEQEAKRSNLSIELLASDNYNSLEQHRNQFETLASSGVDALILGSMHYRAMDKLINTAKHGKQDKPLPIVGMINDLYAQEVDGKVMVPFLDMGYEAGEFVKRHARHTGQEKISVAFLPGPINAGWAPDSLLGFVNAMRSFNGAFELKGPFWGSVDGDLQQLLVEKAFEGNQSIDYLVGNAVAAVKAAELVKVMGLEKDVFVVSTYYSPALEPYIQAGEILAAPSDQTELLGRIAVDMALKLIEGEKSGTDFPFRVSPHIPIITAYQFE